MIRAVDYFAGLGGFTEGARLVGARVVCAINHSPRAAVTSSGGGNDGSADQLAMFRELARKYPDAVVIHLAPHPSPQVPAVVITTWNATGAKITHVVRIA